MEILDTYLELRFDLRGKTLPADHGYSLYAAIKQKLQESDPATSPLNIPPEVHISSINGISDRTGMIHLGRKSYFRLRCPAEKLQVWYQLLQNQVFEVQGHLIRLIQPRILLLEPQSSLRSRLVTFKFSEIDNADLPSYFIQSCQKRLESLKIEGKVWIPSDLRGDLARKTLKIKGKSVVGYSVVVEELSDADSVKLQIHGLGGRRHFGCGWFYPALEAEHDAA